MLATKASLKDISIEELAKNCDETSRLLKSLAHPQRLQILCHLSQRKRTVGELEDLCGASQSAVSQFLNRMKSEGLVTAERSGQFVHYRILDGRVLKLIQSLHRIFCP